MSALALGSCPGPGLHGRLALCLLLLLLLGRDALREMRAPRLAVPPLVDLGLDPALDEQLRKLPSLGLALDRHGRSIPPVAPPQSRKDFAASTAASSWRALGLAHERRAHRNSSAASMPLPWNSPASR